MYIGDTKVLEDKKSDKDGFIDIKVEIKDNGEDVTRKYTIHEDVYDMITSDEEGMSNVPNNVVQSVATYLLTLLSKYELPFYQVQAIGKRISELSRKARDDAMAKEFDVDHIQDINFKDIVDYL